jgi:nitrite reductase/ring-hydroxylating ferredoxin subunit
MAFVKAAEVGSVTSGEGIVVELEGKTIALFHIDGKYYATQNRCVHRGGPLGEGVLEGTVVTCPWHGWEFDVSNGTCPGNPKARIETYPVKIEGKDLLVDV